MGFILLVLVGEIRIKLQQLAMKPFTEGKKKRYSDRYIEEKESNGDSGEKKMVGDRLNKVRKKENTKEKEQ